MEGVIGQVSPALLQSGGGYRTPGAAAIDRGIAIGNGASAGAGIAIGKDATATAPLDIAIGYNAYANDRAFAFGSNASAGERAIALGEDAYAGVDSVAVGENSLAWGSKCSALGGNAYADSQSVALGESAWAYGGRAVALGSDSYANDNYAIALGSNASAGLPGIASINALHAITPGTSSTDWHRLQQGARVVIMSHEVDLTTTGDYDIDLPTGLHFYIDEVGVLCTEADSISTQPTVRFGDSGDRDAQLAAVQTTELTAAFRREIFSVIDEGQGETNISAGVSSAASATTMMGRFYWAGMAVVDES